MFIWDFVADKILGQIVDWFYGQVVGFLGNFFAEMGNMGVELFEMSWVQSIVLFFSYLAWALYGTGLVVACFECGIEYSSGRGNIRETALNAIKGFMAVSLFTVVPVRLYELSVLSRLNAFLDSELEQVLCFDSAIDAEKFASEKSAIFLILPEEDTTKNFMAGLMIQNLSRELFAVADENGGKLQNRAVLYCDEFGTMPPFDVLPLFSAGRSRRLTLVPIIQSLAQLEKNYGKEGSEIIQDNCQDTIFGGFAPNSQTAEVLSKALGNRTVLSGSVSRGKNDPSQSLQMMERPLLTPDELKSIPKGNFIVQKTGQHPMRTRLRLFLEWGITFEEPYIVPERADRAVAYANREDLERNLPQSNKAENADMRGAYAVSGRGGIAHEPAVDKPRRRGGKQMKTYGEEDL